MKMTYSWSVTRTDIDTDFVASGRGHRTRTGANRACLKALNVAERKFPGCVVAEIQVFGPEQYFDGADGGRKEAMAQLNKLRVQPIKPASPSGNLGKIGASNQQKTSLPEFQPSTT